MADNVLKEKNLNFAVRCVKLHKHLCDQHSEYVLSKQMLRSGTSIGANIREALCAESDKDFTHKLHISLKEANETQYWFEVMLNAGIISDNEFTSINKDLAELMALLTSIIKSMKQKNFEPANK
ncbi:MAG: four helix bundle protein [Bacteroidales bacterium]|nr:four helix bundle protein [Bacteroidales bacterium]